tara:strand:+ start:857 stop:1102 length:246 start_codon:yes stop_codon:yes gene_type:complete
MEIVGDGLLELALLIIKKSKIEKELRKTFKCILKKIFSCCGLKNLENELKYLNESILNIQNQIQDKKIHVEEKKIKRYSSI